HALSRADRKVAMLCRLAWLEGLQRKKLFTSTPLSQVLVFSKRLHMQRGRQADATGAGGMIAFAWFVWDHGHVGPCSLGWLE
ncbi:hypothetical protein N4Q63_27625, partial [Leclercia adecarboxylata]|nr:hypothetical protein [Leclercia adecarboxylata]